MTRPVVFGLTLFSAIGCGLVAGIFFAFSTFVMKALARLPAPQAIAAMQSINGAVINPLFLSAFLGTGASCALLIVAALRAWKRPSAGYLLAGSLLYLAGTIGVTMLCNVPRNNALDAVDLPAPAPPSFGLATSPVGPPGITSAPLRLWRPRRRSPSGSLHWTDPYTPNCLARSSVSAATTSNSPGLALSALPPGPYSSGR